MTVRKRKLRPRRRKRAKLRPRRRKRAKLRPRRRKRAKRPVWLRRSPVDNQVAFFECNLA